jgi:hypothetical protein
MLLRSWSAKEVVMVVMVDRLLGDAACDVGFLLRSSNVLNGV